MKRIISMFGCLALVGCAQSIQQQEANLAKTMMGFQNQTVALAASRRTLVKGRQSVINGLEADAAMSRIDADRQIATWKVVGEDDKLKLYVNLLAATDSAMKADQDLAALHAQHDKAMLDADTRFRLDQQKLSLAIQGISSLGLGLSPEDTAKFYLRFAADTIAAVDAAKTKSEAVKADGDAAAAAARDTASTVAERAILSK